MKSIALYKVLLRQSCHTWILKYHVNRLIQIVESALQMLCKQLLEDDHFRLMPKHLPFMKNGRGYSVNQNTVVVVVLVLVVYAALATHQLLFRWRCSTNQPQPHLMDLHLKYLHLKDLPLMDTLNAMFAAYFLKDELDIPGKLLSQNITALRITCWAVTSQMLLHTSFR